MLAIALNNLNDLIRCVHKHLTDKVARVGL